MFLLPKKGVFIVAEIGKNFIQTEDDQSIDTYIKNAKELIKAAKEAGADAVKFQTHEVTDEHLPVKIISDHFTENDRYSWVKRNTEAAPPRFWNEISSYCASIGITFVSTPMSRMAAEKLRNLDMPFWKVGSADIRDYVLINYLIKTKKPIIISTGMASLSELDEVIRYISSAGTRLAALYCVSLYPCPPEKFNLSTIEYLKEKYPGVAVGFSDHSIGDSAALAAVKTGARIIEKHFSFSRDLWGPDHKVSMTPDEMESMVKMIRGGDYKNADESAFWGYKYKELEGAHNKFRSVFEKSLVAGGPIKAGEKLTEEMIFAMRPASIAGGIEPHKLPEIIGKRAKRDLNAYDHIIPEILE